MTSATADTEFGLRWRARRVILAELGDLDASALREDGTRFAVACGRPAEGFEALVQKERRRLQLPERTIEASGIPTPIAQTLNGLLLEDPRSVITVRARIGAVFEVVIKYAASVVVSDALATAGGGLPSELLDGIHGALAQSLPSPSLGHWLAYTRAALAFLAARPEPMFAPEVAEFYRRRQPELDAVVTNRNWHSHGSVAEAEIYVAHIDELFPMLARVLDSASFLKRYALLACDGGVAFEARGLDPTPADDGVALADGDVALRGPRGGGLLELSPLIVYRPCRQPRDTGRVTCGAVKFLFYNSGDRKRRALSFLDYRWGHQGSDPAPYAQFDQHFPLDHWHRGNLPPRFRGLIRDRAAGLVGRDDELAAVEAWIDAEPRGACLITGPSGVGKSALVATLCVRERPDVDVACYFIERARRPTGSDFLLCLIEQLSPLGRGDGLRAGTLGELRNDFERCLDDVSRAPGRSKRKLLLVVDGLDECLSDDGASAGGDELLRVLPGRVPERVYLLLASQRQPRIEELLDATIDRALPRKVMALGGISPAAVDAYLRHHASRYGITAEYVDQVWRKSDGNPLFMVLLAQAVVSGELPINDTERLPTSLDAQFKQLLARHVGRARSFRFDALLALSIAREPMSTRELSELLTTAEGEVEGFVGECVDVLTFAEEPGEARRYSLFHDRFAGWLRGREEGRARLPDLARALLRLAWRRREGRAEDPAAASDDAVDALIDRLVGGARVPPGDAPALACLLDAARGDLTAFELVIDSLRRRPVATVGALLHRLAWRRSSAVATAVVRVLGADQAAPLDDLLALLRALTAPPGSTELVPGGRGPSGPAAPPDADASLVQAASITTRVVAGLVGHAALHPSLSRLLADLCTHRHDPVAALGVLALTDLSRTQVGFCVLVLRELAGRAHWHGVVRPRAAAALAGALLSVFYERTDDPGVRAELRSVLSDLLPRLRGLWAVAWLGPGIIATGMGQMPDDYATVNVHELKLLKRDLADRGYAQLLRRVTDFIDPAHGSPEDWRALHDDLRAVAREKRSTMVMMPYQACLVARGIAGPDEALEAPFEFWEWAQENGVDTVLSQHLPYDLKIIQMGRRAARRPPLPPVWRERAERMARTFFDRGASFRGYRSYSCGCLVSVFTFIQRCDGVDGAAPSALLEELIDRAFERVRVKAGRLKGSPRAGHEIMLRVLEVNSLEYGSWEPEAREVAWRGVRRIVTRHAAVLDDAAWESLATTLARLSAVDEEGTERFLRGLPPGAQTRLRRRLPFVSSGTNVGALIGLRSERFLAFALGPDESGDGSLRALWQRAMRRLVARERPATTLRAMTRELLTHFVAPR